MKVAGRVGLSYREGEEGRNGRWFARSAEAEGWDRAEAERGSTAAVARVVPRWGEGGPWRASAVESVGSAPVGGRRKGFLHFAP